MKKVWLAGVSSLLLTGCPTDSPEMTQMQSAYSAGNVQACYAVERLNRDQRHRLTEAMNGMTLSCSRGVRPRSTRPVTGAAAK